MSLRVNIPEELEKKFRKEAMEIFGYNKGSLSAASETALKNWVESVELVRESKKIRDPVESMDGMLKGVKMESVELQHKTKKIWAKKALKHVSH